MIRTGGTMQVVVCDDDEGCCAEIERWLEAYARREKVKFDISIYNSAEKLVGSMKDHQWFDVIFLDIELPEMTGIEVGHEIRNHLQRGDVSIVFISGKTEYCMELFELEPMNFHYKPLREEDIVKDMDKAIHRHNASRSVIQYTENGVQKGILLRDVLYAEAKGKASEIHTLSGDSIEVRSGVSKLAEEYGSFHMCQCHRSFLVNLSYVEKYYKQTLYLKNDVKIPVGRWYTEIVKNAWASYDFDMEA